MFQLITCKKKFTSFHTSLNRYFILPSYPAMVPITFNIQIHTFINKWNIHITNMKINMKILILCCCWVVQSHFSCVWLCDSLGCGPPGSSVHGIFQARILEWIAISFSRGASQQRDRTCVSCRQILYCWASREHMHILKYYFPLWFIIGYWI